MLLGIEPENFLAALLLSFSGSDHSAGIVSSALSEARSSDCRADVLFFYPDAASVEFLVVDLIVCSNRAQDDYEPVL